MKRLVGLILSMVLLWGCADNGAMDHAMDLRERIQSGGCTFRAVISADYGDRIHTFVMDCSSDDRGTVTFTVAAPDTISGITGVLSGEEGFLTFDEELLAFSMLADGQLSPVSAPWILVNTLRGGYLRYTAETDTGCRLTIDDSYSDRAMQVDVWLNGEGLPVEAEILWQGRRILTVQIENFEIL